MEIIIKSHISSGFHTAVSFISNFGGSYLMKCEDLQDEASLVWISIQIDNIFVLRFKKLCNVLKNFNLCVH